jgi:metallophosphoesterase (TIGR00282 family)
MKVLFFGDIMGKIGRRAIAEVLPHWKQKYVPDIVVANVENLAHGKGVTQLTLEEMREVGIDCFTSGNHIWAKPEVFEIFARGEMPLVRPANYPDGAPGEGARLVQVGDKTLLLINLMGRVFMPGELDCPFRKLDSILDEYKDVERNATIIDFHAEASSEKVSFSLYADGRVSAVVGTHTHIPTADEEILPKGTAHISDVGMVGAKYSSIGVDIENVLKRFLTQLPVSHEIPESGPTVVNAVLIEIDEQTQKSNSIQRIQETVNIQ